MMLMRSVDPGLGNSTDGMPYWSSLWLNASDTVSYNFAREEDGLTIVVLSDARAQSMERIVGKIYITISNVRFSLNLSLDVCTS